MEGGQLGPVAALGELGQIAQQQRHVRHVEHRAAERLVALQQQVAHAAQARRAAADALGGREAEQAVRRALRLQLTEQLARGRRAPLQHLADLAADPLAELRPVAAELARHRVQLAQGPVLGREQALVAYR